MKINRRTQYYRCQGYEHLANQYPRQTETLLVEVLIEEDEKEVGLEVDVYKQNDDSDVSAEDRELNGCIWILALTDLTPNYDRAYLEVVKYILAQPKQVNEWRRTVIFQTFTKIGEKSKVIVDNDSCINAIALINNTLGIKSVKHSNSYKVTWIDTTSIDVQERCQISIQFVTYTDNVWCDILSMDVGHIILR